MSFFDKALTFIYTVQDFVEKNQKEFDREMTHYDRKKDKNLIREYKDLSRSSGNNIKKSALRMILKGRGYADEDN